MMSSERTTAPPPLIKILGYLGAARGGFWVSCSDERRITLIIISSAACDAERNNHSFTKKYISDYLDRMKYGQEFCTQARAWVDEIDGEVDGFGEILAAIEWVCIELNDLTGISIREIMQTIDRKGSDDSEPMEGGGYGSECLNHVAVRLRELDSDGNGARIWQVILQKCRIIRHVWTRSIKGESAAREDSKEGPCDVKPAKVAKGKRINECMAKTLIENPNSIDWTVTDWVEKLKCSKSTVQETATWERIMTTRKLREVEKATEQRHHKPTDKRRMGKKRSED
jgi:hypothetical protein